VQRAASLSSPGRPGWVIAVCVLSGVVLVGGVALIVLAFSRKLWMKSGKSVEEAKSAKELWGPRVLVAAGITCMVAGAVGIALPLILVQ
jgi:hypothetical protein